MSCVSVRCEHMYAVSMCVVRMWEGGRLCASSVCVSCVSVRCEHMYAVSMCVVHMWEGGRLCVCEV